MLGKIKWWFWFVCAVMFTCIVAPMAKLVGLYADGDDKQSLFAMIKECVRELYESDPHKLLGAQQEESKQ